VEKKLREYRRDDMTSVLNRAYALLHPIDHREINDGFAEEVAKELRRKNYSLFKSIIVACPSCALLAVWILIHHEKN